MLKKLSVTNFALMDAVEIQFSEGLNMITGETGAGKSALLGSLSLVLGERADTKVLRNVSAKCVVEAEFSLEAKEWSDFFAANDLDFESLTTLRREILPEGKSRAFINDTPVNLALLKELGSALVDIHSQHESIEMFERRRQLQLLDAYAEAMPLWQQYQAQYKKWIQLKADIQSLESQLESGNKDLEFRNFQFNELEAAGLKEAEWPILEKEADELSNTEGDGLALQEAIWLLDEHEHNVISGIRQISALVHKLHKEKSGLDERLQFVLNELMECKYELQRLSDTIQADPERLSEIQDRMNVIQKLMMKHRVQTVEELIEIRDDLSKQLFDSDQLEEALTQKKTLCNQWEEECRNITLRLSEARTKAKLPLEQKVTEFIRKLSMPNAEFSIVLERTAELSLYGQDQVVFYFNANKGGIKMPLGKVVSGGELSRLMLVLKSVLAEKVQLPALFLDEIDSGVSGETAFAMAEMLKERSRDMQVFCISHLPQMASAGDSHYHVYKEEGADKTYTRIRKLGPEERQLEIATMIAGRNHGNSALESARELLHRFT